MFKLDSVTPIPAMSNTERQRQFRERNPGYYGRLHRKRKADEAVRIAARMAQMQAAAPVAEQTAEPVGEEAKTPLVLPAPAIVFSFEGLNAIPTTARVEEREAVMIPVGER